MEFFTTLNEFPSSKLMQNVKTIHYSNNPLLEPLLEPFMIIFVKQEKGKYYLKHGIRSSLCIDEDFFSGL